MMYYLDTNIIIYALKNQFPSIKEHFLQTPSTCIVVPSVVLAEIEYGARKSNDYNKTIALYNAFTKSFQTVSFNQKSVLEYGLIRSNLERKGQTIGQNDLLIASIVKSNNGILVTHNTKEFERVDDLKIEDWCY